MNREQLEQKRDEIRTQNDTAWNRMLNLLQQRDHPVIVWVTAENRDLRDQMFRLLSIELQDRYIHKSQNLSKVKVTDSFSLYQLLRQETAVTDTENDTYPLFHIFGLESLVTADENDPAEAFARELNFERELLFRHLPASVVFWSDEPAQVRVQSLAPDFWDWLVYKFHFRMLPGTLQWQHNIESRFSGLATAMPPKQQQEIDELEERLHKLDPLVTKGDRFAADYAQVALNLGNKWFFFDNHEAARALYQQALPLFEKVGSDLGKANTLKSLGDLERLLSENDKARALYQQALPLFEKVGSDLGKANTLQSLGDLERLLSENDKARALYQQALPLFEKVGDDLGKANTLKSLGDLEMRMSENDKARALYQQALPLFEKVGSDLGKANTLKSLGDLEMRMSENDKARALYQQALPLFEKVGDDLGKANTLKSLGDLERLLSENDSACPLSAGSPL
ncbi:MAG: tetratricopeptide repeat protein [Lewinellaceae bacterium]|nr:tetratricopeptide repeat protein [Lewinellaceae bacterium]